MDPVANPTATALPLFHLAFPVDDLAAARAFYGGLRFKAFRDLNYLLWK
jgi:catechol 2,3-dioxygenase-like lactoylglutathione lyase family enzyme